MNPRLEKFSLDRSELVALEAAIQCLIGLDALKNLEKKDDTGAASRFAPLVARATREGWRTALHVDVRSGDKLKAELRTILPELRRVVIDGFSTSNRLHATLAMLELLTVQPYAGDEATKKLKVADDARDSAVELIATAVPFEGQSPRESAAIVRGALEKAEGVFKNSWKRAGFVLGATITTAVAGIFAGPFIGGLIGSWFLGLSGAAAVSAGLALLGGGSLAAGGFGMIGGTVLIASAFGAAGAGASGAFLGDGGKVIAKLTTIRHLAAFDALLSFELMDHQLAEDFIEALELQHAEYERIAEEDGRDHKQAAKVAAVLHKGTEWIKDRYAKAVRQKRVRRDPVAWSQCVAPTLVNIEDPDFAALATAIIVRRRQLEHCLSYLRNAHRSYAEVKDADFMVALIQCISGKTREHLVAGHQLLRGALDEILALAHAWGDDVERLVAAMSKIAATAQQLLERDATIERYEKLSREMFQEVRRLATDNDALRAQAEQMDRMLARALLLASIYRANQSIRRLGPGSAEPAPFDEPAQTASDDGWSCVVIDLAIAMLIDTDTSAQLELESRARAAGFDLPDRREIEETMAALGLALGTSAERVQACYRERFGEVHPDRYTLASDPVARLLRLQRDRLNRAREIHLRYIATRAPAETA